jgi:transposase
VRVPSAQGSGKRRQEVRTYPTMTRSLLVLADRLGELGVTRVVMEATSDYWRGVFYLLEAHGLETWLVNARDVKHLPGRPKTDTLDAVWLCKVAERQMLRPSFVPPRPIRQLRDAGPLPDRSGGGTDRGEAAGRAGCRVDAQIKLSVVASDIFGVSGRAMLAALVAGERDPKVPSAAGPYPVARQTRPVGGGVRRVLHRPARVPAGQDAGPGGCAGCRSRRARRQAPGADRPLAAAVERLDEIPGVGQTAAYLLIAEIGADTGQVPDRWAPGLLGQVRLRRQGVRRQTQGQRIHRGRQPYLGRVLGEAAVAASKTTTFLGERYRRIARRRGKKRAIVAVGRSILVIAWHLLSDPEAHFHDLGAGFYDTRIGPERAKRNHVRQLEALGYKVTLQPAA